ncbi:MAG TPA: hypothetical protein VLJ17_14685 [Xanthobacteraceae bacterium]|nr:hypothetical protein [Xanthobacteraceae bacterium]
MLDTDSDIPALDPPDADAVYARYLETCKHLGVEPVPRERAQELIAEWSEVIAASRSAPPITHGQPHV